MSTGLGPERPRHRLAAHRAQQFIHALSPRIETRLLRDATRVLEEGEFRLFLRMSAADQSHCLKVYALLRTEHGDDPELLRAALLHDVGKSLARLSVWDRVRVVLWDSRVFGFVARACGHRGENDFVVAHKMHAHRGAALAHAGGSPERVVRLIRHHDSPSEAALDASLMALLQADNDSEIVR